MNAWVRFSLPDGRSSTLIPGDLIGRTWTAALRIDDPLVSEAHALVSLRGDALVLLALRRRIYVDNRPVDPVELSPGLRVRLTPQIELRVEELALPKDVLGLEGDGLPAQVLTGTRSLVFQPEPSLEPRLVERAAAVLWPNEHRWRFRLAGGPDADLEVGTRFQAGGRSFRGVSMTLASAGQTPTRADSFGPLKIVSFFDSVHLHRADGVPLVLSGQMARVMAELVAIGNPVAWEELAGQLWPTLTEREVLRRRWDVLMVRLRERLREAGIRSDLVQSTGHGLVELVRQEGDVVEDRG